MIPVLLCGGHGSRLWPLSSDKPFYPFFDYSLFEMSLKRLKDFEPFTIVSVENLKCTLEEILKNTSYKTEIVYEPEAKNTAASIALVCHLLSKKQRGKNILGVFPSDHYIGKELEFKKLVSTGVHIANSEQKVVTFGIVPQYPSQDYGYIKTENTIKSLNGTPVKQARHFIEKPDISEASSLTKEGYLWNSGIFLSPVHVLIRYFKEHLPALWQHITRAEEDLKSIRQIYQNIESISFDQGIMKNLRDFMCLPCDITWQDLGTWNRIANLSSHPVKFGSKAQVVLKDSNENFVFSTTDKQIGLVGIENTFVINSEKGLLVAKRDMENGVKYISEKFKTKGVTHGKDKKWVKKPWGAYRVIEGEPGFKIKEIKVEPLQQLSYQSHNKRAEHWIITQGTAEATIEGKIHTLKEGEYIFIAKRAKHRLKNPNPNTLLSLLEVWVGKDSSEDDIIRYQDDYGRV